jgi:RNA polymerase sigma-70 factor (ECF subfamily)
MPVPVLAATSLGPLNGAEEVVRRYERRLIALARARMSAKLLRREGPEDVVQSAFRSFFRVATEDHIELGAGNDVWPLLVLITIRKVQRKVEYHTAGLRSIHRESSLALSDSACDLAAGLADREPSSEDAAELADEIDAVLRDFLPLHRAMVEAMLQGAAVDEIAATAQRSERLVNKVRTRFREALEQRLADGQEA